MVSGFRRSPIHLSGCYELSRFGDVCWFLAAEFALDIKGLL